MKRLKRLAKDKLGVSQRKLALQLSVSQPNICRKLSEIELRYRKRIKTPKYSEAQAERSKELSRKLSNLFYRDNSIIVMDDEKYFGFYSDETPGNSGFYTTNIRDTPNNVKFKGKEKYPKKMLVWLAISERGISEPYIRPVRSPAINQNIYLEECLKKDFYHS